MKLKSNEQETFKIIFECIENGTLSQFKEFYGNDDLGIYIIPSIRFSISYDFLNEIERHPEYYKQFLIENEKN